MRATFPPLAIAAAVLVGSHAGLAATLTFNSASDGHSRKQGVNISETSASLITGEGGSGLEYRGFISINITSLTEQVTAAQLLLRVQTYNNSATSSTFRLFDYTSGPAPTSIIGGDSAGRFADLGSGVQYGTASIDSGANPPNSFLAINLTADAINSLNSGAGVYTVNGSRFFTIGLADANVSGSDSFNVRFFSGTGSGVNQLVVQTVPEPGVTALAATGMAVMMLRRRRERDRHAAGNAEQSRSGKCSPLR